MAGHSAGDDNGTDEDFDAIENFQFSPSSTSHVHVPAGVEHSAGHENDVYTDDEIRQAGTNSAHMGISDETFATFIEMGFTEQLISRAIEENGANLEPGLILETLVKYSANSEASPSSSKSKIIDHFVGMGFSEQLVIKIIQDYGEENIDAITNALLSCVEVERLLETEDKDINRVLSSDSNDDDNFHYLLSSDEEHGVNSSHEDSINFSCARQFDEYFEIPGEKEASIDSKKRRLYNEMSIRGRRPNATMANDDELIQLPKPMIGFGVPNEPGLMMERPVPIPDVARGPPFFYFENVALAPRGVWATISRHLYDIMPEFVDSMYFCAAMRKRGYVHNLPIKNRFQIQPLPRYTIQEAFPVTRRWWPSWDRRTKLNCLVTCKGSAKLTNKIRSLLEKYDGTPPVNVQNLVMDQCKRWNLVWVGKNKLAPLEPDEMEKLLGFPRDHTRGGGVSSTDRYKSLGNSFQVDTVAYHLSVLKTMFPEGIKVLSLFTGIGGGEVALHRLRIPMKVVVSVEKSEVNRNILSSFWEQTNQQGILREFEDVELLDNQTIEQLMDQYGAFDLVIGGSPCNNISGANRVSRNGLEGKESSLFYEYCRILDTVRRKAARMRRG